MGEPPGGQPTPATPIRPLRIGPTLAEDPDAHPPTWLDLSEPVIQPMILSDPRDWRATGMNQFSSTNPDGMRL
jgi:hypothetical protein